MCNADLSVEGDSPLGGPGWGGTRVCRDFEAVRNWEKESFGEVFERFIGKGEREKKEEENDR